jgi:23S rRNA pseudouridine2605 synthase
LSIRLNKLLARRGLGARRKCDALIQSGAVRVNDEVVTEPGTQIEPGRDRVTVQGRPLPPSAPPIYYALNKPVGTITTLDDPEGRPTIRDLMPPGPRLFPVGRLDADTSGLLILTNDGELAHHLMHPRYGVAKVYRVRLDRAPVEQQLGRLRTGVEFEPGVVSGPARVRMLESGERGAMIEIVIHEGRYRQVRRMCEALGLRVMGLHRTAYGPLRIGPLARGMWRELSEDEVLRLRASAARPRPLRRAGRGAGRGRPVPRHRRRPSAPREEARFTRGTAREPLPRSSGDRVRRGPYGEQERAPDGPVRASRASERRVRAPRASDRPDRAPRASDRPGRGSRPGPARRGSSGERERASDRPDRAPRAPERRGRAWRARPAPGGPAPRASDRPDRAPRASDRPGRGSRAGPAPRRRGPGR